MKINSLMLLRDSSSVDKDGDHPQLFDRPYPLEYLQVGVIKEPHL